MNTHDFHKYYMPAAVAILGPDAELAYLSDNEGYKLLMEFDAMIGIPLFEKYKSRPAAHDFPLPELHRALLEKLAGPNGQFWLRVRKARMKED